MQQFSLEDDIEQIHKACKGIGTNEKKLIDAIMPRPKAYLQQLRQAYPAEHKVDLIHLVKKECSGNLERCLVAALRTDAENRAQFLFDAVKGAGTDEDALIEVLCTALPSQIHTIKAAWNELFSDHSWEKRVKSEVSGDFEMVLKAVMSDDRPEAGVLGDKMAKDIEKFFAATEGKLGTDEKVLCKLVKKRSREHLWALNEAFRARSKKGRSAFEVIVAETSGDLEKALCAAFTPPAHWYAYRMHTAMKGAGTNERALIRNVFLPQPFELKMANDTLSHLYKEDLTKRIKSETSGDFERALVAYVKFILKG